MTSAPISVGSRAVNLLSGAGKAPAVNADVNFKTLLDRQTGQNAAGKTSQEPGRSQGADKAAGSAGGAKNADRQTDAADTDAAKADAAEADAAKAAENAQEADVPKEDLSGKDSVDTNQEAEAAETKPAGEAGDSQDAEPDGGEAQSEARWAAVMELLGQTAQSFTQQAADTLGLSGEELEGLMKELGMDRMDLLKPENLKLLAMAAEGETDGSALLTNGELYGKVQELTGRLEEALKAAGMETGLDPDRLAGLLKQAQGKTAVLPEAAAGESGGPRVVVEMSPADAAAMEQTDGTAKAAQETAAEGEAHAEEAPGIREKQSAGGEAGSRHTAGGQENNPFAQSFSQLQRTAAQQPAAAQPVFAPDTQDIMRQIMDYMKIRIQPDMTSMELALHPESLGSLHVQVASKEGVMTAHFVTENETVKNALESQIIQLRESFSEQGVRVEAIEVTVQPHAFEQNLEQGRERNGDEPGKKGRTRRINLNGLSDGDELPDEDQLAADMMAANGGTVDYMA